MVNTVKKFISLANKELNEGNVTGAIQLLEISNRTLSDVFRFNSTMDENAISLQCKPVCDSCGPGGGLCCGLRCGFNTLEQ